MALVAQDDPLGIRSSACSLNEVNVDSLSRSGIGNCDDVCSRISRGDDCGNGHVSGLHIKIEALVSTGSNGVARDRGERRHEEVDALIGDDGELERGARRGSSGNGEGQSSGARDQIAVHKSVHGEHAGQSDRCKCTTIADHQNSVDELVRSERNRVNARGYDGDLTLVRVGAPKHGHSARGKSIELNHTLCVDFDCDRGNAARSLSQNLLFSAVRRRKAVGCHDRCWLRSETHALRLCFAFVLEKNWPTEHVAVKQQSRKASDHNHAQLPPQLVVRQKLRCRKGQLAVDGSCAASDVCSCASISEGFERFGGRVWGWVVDGCAVTRSVRAHVGHRIIVVAHPFLER